jgi:hypothetical protein
MSHGLSLYHAPSIFCHLFLAFFLYSPSSCCCWGFESSQMGACSDSLVGPVATVPLFIYLLGFFFFFAVLGLNPGSQACQASPLPLESFV